MKTDKTGDAMGRPSWRSSFLGDPSAKFFCANGGMATKPEETASSCRGACLQRWERRQMADNGATHDE